MNALPPTSNTKYTVFFSHKIGNKSVTKNLLDLLDRNTENVSYFVSENIEKGTAWREAIATQLTASSYLVLVFTDPDEDWGWCLWETGFFDALRRYHNSGIERRIYCLHHAMREPPSPIKDLQSVPATPEDVEQWLRELFTNTEQKKKAFWDEIPALAGKICELFSVDQKPIYQQRSIDIEVNCSLMTSPDDLPDSTQIEGDESLMQELFGSFEARVTWGIAKRRLGKFPNSADVNMNTLKELSRAIWGIYSGNIVRPVQGIIFVDQGPKRYRPVIDRAKALTKDRICCEVLLIEEVSGPLQNVDKLLAALLTSIRIGVRIRWEIIRPFASKVRQLAKLNAKKLRFDLQTCFNNIFLEAEFRGHFSPEELVSAFESTDDQDKIMAIMEEWGQVYPDIWRGIGFPDLTETFGEVSNQPMTDADLALLETGLCELKKLNREFLDIAATRLEVLIKRELSG